MQTIMDEKEVAKIMNLRALGLSPATYGKKTQARSFESDPVLNACDSYVAFQLKPDSEGEIPFTFFKKNGSVFMNTVYYKEKNGKRYPFREETREYDKSDQMWKQLLLTCAEKAEYIFVPDRKMQPIKH